jgi:hypothetical protein
LALMWEQRLQRFFVPILRSANFLQTRGVLVYAGFRERSGASSYLSNGVNVRRFWINVECRRIVLHLANDFVRVGRRPTRATVAATTRILFEPPERNVVIAVRVGAAQILDEIVILKLS